MNRVGFAMALTFIVSPLHAGDVTFTSNGIIQDGDDYDNVFIYDTPPDHTTVTMTGGDVGALLPYDQSIVEVLGGFILSLYSQEASTANIHGGVIPNLTSTDSSVMNVYAGELGFFSVEAWSTSTANIHGGLIQGTLGAIDSAILNLYGGEVEGTLVGWDSSTINIFGYGFQYDPTGGGTGQLPLLTGFWLDDTPFELRLRDEETYTHINLIPEPGTLALLLLAAPLAFRRRMLRQR